MATHSSILAWRIPCTEEPGGLQSTSQKELDTTEPLTFFIQVEPTGSHKSLKEEIWSMIREREEMMEERTERCYLADPEDGGRDLEPKNIATIWS